MRTSTCPWPHPQQEQEQQGAWHSPFLHPQKEQEQQGARPQPLSHPKEEQEHQEARQHPRPHPQREHPKSKDLRQEHHKATKQGSGRTPNTTALELKTGAPTPSFGKDWEKVEQNANDNKGGGKLQLEGQMTAVK